MINFIPNNFNLGFPMPEYTQPGGDAPISAKSGFNFNNNFLNPFSYNPLINSSEALSQLGGLFANPSANSAGMGNQSMSNVFAPGRDLAQMSGRNSRLMDDFGFRNRMYYDPI